MVGSLAEKFYYKDLAGYGKSLELPSNFDPPPTPRARIRAMAFVGSFSAAIDEILRMGPSSFPSDPLPDLPDATPQASTPTRPFVLF